LTSEVFDVGGLANWDGTTPDSVFLDGLDETLVRIPTLPALITRRLARIAPSRPSVG
jgi:hypothetical protein